MNPVALDLPEDKSQWPAWFEHQLVGPDLRLLVRQLEIHAGQTTPLPDGVTWEEHCHSSMPRSQVTCGLGVRNGRQP
jgi:hypothetical protein